MEPEEEAARDADPALRANPLLGLAPNIYSKSDDGHFIGDGEIYQW